MYGNSTFAALLLLLSFSQCGGDIANIIEVWLRNYVKQQLHTETSFFKDAQVLQEYDFIVVSVNSLSF